MSKKKLSVKKTNRPVKSIPSKKNNSSRTLLIIAAILLVLGALYLGYKGMTGNVVTGNAISDSVQSAWEGTLKPVLQYLLGWDVKGDATNTYQFDDFFSMALLIFLIVFSVVFVVVKSVPFFNDAEHSWTVWLITIAVSLLSVRFLTADWLVTILLPYSTLGIAITAGLPFVLYFFLVQKFQSDTMKRIAWIFFGIIFLYLWYDRTQTVSTIALPNGGYYGIYGWTALAALIMALFGQKTVEKVKTKIKKEKGEKEMTKAQAQKEYNKLHEVQQNLKAIMDQNGADSEDYKTANTQWIKVTKRLSELQQIILH